jgi:hypothetical protein
LGLKQVYRRAVKNGQENYDAGKFRKRFFLHGSDINFSGRLKQG